MDPLPANALGKSGLQVSNICLGTMTFGPNPRPGQCDESLAHQLMDVYAEKYQGNFIDTADVYSNGESEKIVGSWLKKKERDNFVIATKVRFQVGNNVHPNSASLSRKHIMASITGSLERLQTDFVDLYQCHLWDKETPLKETLRTMDDLVRAGKIRYFGVSNFCGWQLQKLMDMSKHMGLTSCISLQNQYSLLVRETELECVDVCRNEGVGFLPWSPLKGGWLSGKFSRDMTEAPAGSRVKYATDVKSKLHSHPDWDSLNKDRTWELLGAMKEAADSHGRTVAQVALKWLLQKDTVPSVVIGAKTLPQLEDNAGAGSDKWKLEEKEMARLDALSDYDVPYPYRMIWDRNASKKGPLGPMTI